MLLDAAEVQGVEPNEEIGRQRRHVDAGVEEADDSFPACFRGMDTVPPEELMGVFAEAEQRVPLIIVVPTVVPGIRRQRSAAGAQGMRYAEQARIVDDVVEGFDEVQLHEVRVGQTRLQTAEERQQLRILVSVH
eukprot:TRINITY_DN1396_c0_g1_i1.p3 TRINITY_DN1396_c0_g1~~TRINITY_DN1396_c0_g1_i1.p3  ORF type:complete len:134 (+),score=12.84 TRINITY_DN1396_c0_g1_i1:123-524(+)